MRDVTGIRGGPWLCKCAWEIVWDSPHGTSRRDAAVRTAVSCVVSESILLLASRHVGRL